MEAVEFGRRNDPLLILLYRVSGIGHEKRILLGERSKLTEAPSRAQYVPCTPTNQAAAQLQEGKVAISTVYTFQLQVSLEKNKQGTQQEMPLKSL